ncbi:hypothetical protein FD725_15825 [Nostoc sp. TCL26-01]|nr:hypothetical protein FD725_15825 [Nostoc sp. TCL26-01]
MIIGRGLSLFDNEGRAMVERPPSPKGDAARTAIALLIEGIAFLMVLRSTLAKRPPLAIACGDEGER